jgi:protein phosphatase
MKAFGISHRGVVRRENQDCFRLYAPENRELLTAVLCDGMGGAQAGGLAGTLAADTFMFHAANSVDESSTAADLRTILTEAVAFANQKVYDHSFADLTCMGMGTTLVALLVCEKRAFVANIGDSRAYLIQRGSIRQITKDHSLVEDLVERGKLSREEAKTHPKKNIITRAVGVEPSVSCALFPVRLSQTGRILLCSDGLSNVLTEREILDIVNGNDDPERACTVLLERALEKGAPDNVTVVLAQR